MPPTQTRKPRSPPKLHELRAGTPRSPSRASSKRDGGPRGPSQRSSSPRSLRSQRVAKPSKAIASGATLNAVPESSTHAPVESPTTLAAEPFASAVPVTAPQSVDPAVAQLAVSLTDDSVSVATITASASSTQWMDASDTSPAAMLESVLVTMQDSPAVPPPALSSDLLAATLPAVEAVPTSPSASAVSQVVPTTDPSPAPPPTPYAAPPLTPPAAQMSLPCVAPPPVDASDAAPSRVAAEAPSLASISPVAAARAASLARSFDDMGHERNFGTSPAAPLTAPSSADPVMDQLAVSLTDESVSVATITASASSTQWMDASDTSPAAMLESVLVTMQDSPAVPPPALSSDLLAATLPAVEAVPTSPSASAVSQVVPTTDPSPAPPPTPYAAPPPAPSLASSSDSRPALLPAQQPTPPSALTGNIPGGSREHVALLFALDVVQSFLADSARLEMRLKPEQVSVSSVSTGNSSLENLVDGDLTTYWQSNGSKPHWIEVASAHVGALLGGIVMYIKDHGVTAPKRIVVQRHVEGAWVTCKTIEKLPKSPARWETLLKASEAGPAERVRIEIHTTYGGGRDSRVVAIRTPTGRELLATFDAAIDEADGVDPTLLSFAKAMVAPLCQAVGKAEISTAIANAEDAIERAADADWFRTEAPTDPGAELEAAITEDVSDELRARALELAASVRRVFQEAPVMHAEAALRDAVEAADRFQSDPSGAADAAMAVVATSDCITTTDDAIQLTSHSGGDYHSCIYMPVHSGRMLSWTVRWDHIEGSFAGITTHAGDTKQSPSSRGGQSIAVAYNGSVRNGGRFDASRGRLKDGDEFVCTLDLSVGRFTVYRNGDEYYETSECGGKPLTESEWYPIVIFDNVGEQATVRLRSSGKAVLVNLNAAIAYAGSLEGRVHATLLSQAKATVSLLRRDLFEKETHTAISNAEDAIERAADADWFRTEAPADPGAELEAAITEDVSDELRARALELAASVRRVFQEAPVMHAEAALRDAVEAADRFQSDPSGAADAAMAVVAMSDCITTTDDAIQLTSHSGGDYHSCIYMPVHSGRMLSWTVRWDHIKNSYAGITTHAGGTKQSPGSRSGQNILVEHQGYVSNGKAISYISEPLKDGDVFDCTLDLSVGRFTMHRNGEEYYETSDCGGKPLTESEWYPIVIFDNVGEQATVRSRSGGRTKLANLKLAITSAERLQEHVDAMLLSSAKVALVPLPKTVAEAEVRHAETFVYLDSMDLEALPSERTSLAALKTLHASKNQMKALPETIGDLAMLKTLNVAENALRSLPESVGRLANLAVLNVAKNQMGSLPETIGDLRTLKTLNVAENALRSLPESVGRLAILETLNMAKNQLAALPETIGDLRTLKTLNVEMNALRSLPESLGRLAVLETLDASKNRLAALPASIGKLSSFLKILLMENPLRSPPLSIVVRGMPAIVRYFTALKGESAVVSRWAKLMLVGNGEAGKTSLLRALQRGEPAPTEAHERTIQLDLSELALGEGEDLTMLSCWDLGGQPEYAAAQQPLVVAGVLYLLAVRADRVNDAKYDDAEYDAVLGRWLDVLQAGAAGAVVQPVLTHADKVPMSEHALATDWIRSRITQHRKAFERRSNNPPPPLRIQEPIPVVSAVEGGEASIKDARKRLESIVLAQPPLLPSIGLRIPKPWMAVIAMVRALRDGRHPVAAAFASQFEQAEVVCGPSATFGAVDAMQTEGKVYYEVTLLACGVAPRIGWAAPAFVAPSSKAALGDDAVGWGADGAHFVHDGRTHDLGLAWVDGDVIGIAADLDDFGELHFASNGTWTPAAERIRHFESRRGLFPVVGGDGLRCAINLGASPFRYSPPNDSFVPVIAPSAAKHAFRLVRGEGSSADALRRRPYLSIVQLQSLWTECTTAMGIESDLVVEDILQLLAQQGEIFCSHGIAYLDPDYTTELLKPLVNHQLKDVRLADVKKVLGLSAGGRQGLLLFAAVECLVKKGELREELLPFLWRNSNLATEDYEAVLGMFRASGILFVAEASHHGRRWIMPMRLPTERPSVVPLSLLQAHEAAISLHLDLGSVIPSGLMEQLMGLGFRLGSYDAIWRSGSLLRRTLASGEQAWVLMERTMESPHILLEVGGPQGTEAVLKDLLVQTKGLFDSVASNFAGLRVSELSQTQQPTVSSQPAAAPAPVAAPAAAPTNAPSAADSVNDRFVAPFLVFGQPTTAVAGLPALLGVKKKDLRLLLAEEEEAIVREVRDCGSTERDAHGFCDADWLRYVYEEAAVEVRLEEGMPSDVLDRGHAGMRLDDFVNHPSARAAQLTRAEVLALRLYTTSMYRSVNKPLREGCSETRSHPFPSLIANLSHALSSLRVVRGGSCTPRGGRTLWRGVRDFDLSEEFKERGGTENAPMSTTASKTVAADYSSRNNAQHSLLLCVHANTFMDSGCDISFLSAFPDEQEFLYPPGTYLSVKEGSIATPETVSLTRQLSRGEVAYEVDVMIIDVEPSFPAT